MTLPRAAHDRAAEARAVALWYEPPADGAAGRVWIPRSEKLRTLPVTQAFKSHLLAALLELEPQSGAWLAVLGTETASLVPRAREALRARVAFLPGNGGLLSNLNGWENIVLPLGYRSGTRLATVAPRVHELIEKLGVDSHSLLGKLPEQMSLYEKKTAGYVRILLEAPELVLAENLAGGLEAGDRRRVAAFPALYHAECPDGTFIQLEDVPDE